MSDQAKVTPEAILDDLKKTRDDQPDYSEAQRVRKAALVDVVRRVEDLIAGCTCSPRRLVNWDCTVHPEEDRD